jgi:hypothetical protein
LAALTDSWAALVVDRVRTRRTSMSELTRRWMLACGLAEAIGMGAAAGAAKWSQTFVGGRTGVMQVLLALSMVVAAGLVEGVSLGTAQSWALRMTHPHHRRLRYVTMTILVAGIGWAGASAPGVLAGPAGSGTQPPQGLVVLGGAGLGLVMGCLLGVVQAWVLAPVVVRPARWVVANACAWTPAMAIIFWGATTPGAEWPWWQVVPLGCLTGGVAGAVLGLMLARWVPRLGIRDGQLGSSDAAVGRTASGPAHRSPRLRSRRDPA